MLPAWPLFAANVVVSGLWAVTAADAARRIERKRMSFGCKDKEGATCAGIRLGRKPTSLLKVDDIPKWCDPSSPFFSHFRGRVAHLRLTDTVPWTEEPQQALDGLKRLLGAVRSGLIY